MGNEDDAVRRLANDDGLASFGSGSQPPEIVRVGDTIWFFVELLYQLADVPAPVRVRVVEIHRQADGAKMLRLERVVSTPNPGL